MTTYVYIQSQQEEHPLWTVGFYKPDGKWEPETDHESAEAAAARVRYLNGATEQAQRPTPLYDEGQHADAGVWAQFAAAALQGMLANPEMGVSASRAAEYADALEREYINRFFMEEKI